MRIRILRSRLASLTTDLLYIRSVHRIDKGVAGSELRDGRAGTGSAAGHHPALLSARARLGADQPARAYALH